MPTLSNYADKIRREVAGNSKDRRVEVIKDYVSNAIINFCEQEPEFAQAVEQSDKTIIDCCKECLEGVTTGISDVEACRRVVKCYFPTATIQCQMTIDLCGNTGTPSITMTMDYKDLTIIVPQNDADIQREGAILAHCVGSYSERHANGKLNILFLRRKDNPKQPYYTIEVSSGGQIVQCRGFKNNVPAAGGKKKPPEITEFEKVYQAFLDNIFIKKARTA